MGNNRALLEHFLPSGQIALKHGALLDACPGPMASDFDFARIEAMLLGLAIGDALGDTSESQLPYHRRARYGEIRDYLPNRYANGQPVSLPSDDSQLAFWTLEQMLADGGVNPECWPAVSAGSESSAMDRGLTGSYGGD
jgi:ADP-ribosyl-[dinitrogen reductase] hydrolase